MKKINSLLIEGIVISIHTDKQSSAETTPDKIMFEIVNDNVIKDGKISVNTDILNDHRFFVEISKNILQEIELKVGDDVRIVGYLKPNRICAEHIEVK